MDKETLSNYGWIVICVLVLAVMIALAGPFGTFVADAVKSTTQGLFDVNQGALDAAGITIDDNAFVEGNGGAGENGGTGQTPLTPVAYEIIEGAGQTVATTAASFRSNADYSKFSAVKIDNNVVDPSNYTISEGSTIVTFNGEYLATLSNGTHTLEVVSYDGSASCEFTVNVVAPPTPCTHTNTKIEGAQKATCTSNGHTGKTVCIDCSEVISNGSVIPADHTLNNGVCESCNVALLTFTIDGVTYYAEAGKATTLKQWGNSKYNTLGKYTIYRANGLNYFTSAAITFDDGTVKKFSGNYTNNYTIKQGDAFTLVDLEDGDTLQ